MNDVSQKPRPDPTLFMTAVRALGEGITLADASGRIVYSNPAAARILGVQAPDSSPEEWSKHYGAFLPDTDVPFPAEEHPLVRALHGEETDGIEVLIRNATVPDGVVISVSGRPVLDEKTRIVGAAVVFRDITVRRRNERQLRKALMDVREAQRQKQDLTGFLVHDMKGPLSTIIAEGGLALGEENLSEEVKESLDSMLDGAHRLHRMVLDLLDVQTAEDGHLEPEIEPVRIRAILEEAGDDAEARAAKVEIDADGDLTVLADPTLLLRIVGNLVDNCLKYGPTGGRIWLDAEDLGSESVTIRVKDEGPGVPEELRERIFERYARLERDAGRRHPASRGIGLRFCKVAVEAHGGRIWVEDNQPVGAAFCVELPKSPPKARAAN